MSIYIPAEKKETFLGKKCEFLLLFVMVYRFFYMHNNVIVNTFERSEQRQESSR